MTSYYQHDNHRQDLAMMSDSTSTAAPGEPARAAAPHDDLLALPSLTRWLRALRSLAYVLTRPEATREVIHFLQLANLGANERRTAQFFADPDGARLYAERRKIDSRTVKLDELLALPEDTLGHAYAAFLRSHGLTPEVFDAEPEGVSDPRLAYVILRARQTHDLWHVVTGCETDPAGEVALQAFVYAQVHTPGNGILAVMGALRAARTSPRVFRDVVALFRTGARANPMPAFAWEDHWATPLARVRAMLGLPVQPRRRHAT
jgi:ubiquinone biosynthesis protein COQ4